MAIAKDQYLAEIDEFCDVIHKELGGIGEIMPQEIKKEIFERLVTTEQKTGRKYTKEYLLQTIIQVLKKYTRA